MTSVNNQQRAPQYGYDNTSTQSPVRSEHNTDAQAGSNTPPDSAPARPPVGPEQRGAFSSHRSMVNPQTQGANSQGELAELTQKNQDLRAKLQALSEQYSMRFNELNTKIDNLIAQLSTPDNRTKEAPITPDAAPHNRHAEGHSVPPQTPPEQGKQARDTQDTQESQGTPDTQGTQNTQPSQSGGIDTLAAELTQIQHSVNQLFEQVNTVLNALMDKLTSLAQLLNKGGSQNQTPPAQPDTTATASPDPAAPDATASAPNDTSGPAGDSTAPAPGTVEYIKQENQKLEAEIDQMERKFDEATSTLEKQFDALTQQVREQKQ